MLDFIISFTAAILVTFIFHCIDEKRDTLPFTENKIFNDEFEFLLRLFGQLIGILILDIAFNAETTLLIALPTTTFIYLLYHYIKKKKS